MSMLKENLISLLSASQLDDMCKASVCTNICSDCPYYSVGNLRKLIKELQND